jgi:inhibitor of cysteine peptidase
MKTNQIILIILVLLMGVLTACNSASNETITIDEQNAGDVIELKAGDMLVVSLDGNITTGFNWIPATQDSILLEQLGEAEVTSESEQLGAPGKIVLQFKAIATGQTNLRLEYKRAWEEDVEPEKTFEVTIVVK